MDESETGQATRDKKLFNQDKKQFQRKTGSHEEEAMENLGTSGGGTPAWENPPARVAAVQLDKTMMDAIIAGVAVQLQAKEGSRTKPHKR